MSTSSGASSRVESGCLGASLVQVASSSENLLLFSVFTWRGGRDLKLCGNDGPTGTVRDSESDFEMLRLARDGESGLKRTGGDCTCHNVTDERAELIAMVLSAALAKWRSGPDPDELRGILLRLLVALEAPA